MPSVQTVIRKYPALQYDGTNSSQVVDFCDDNFAPGSITFHVDEETSESLTIGPSDPMWSSFTVPLDGYVVCDTGNFFLTFPADAYAERYSTLTP